MTLSGCLKKDETVIKMIVPFGSPALSSIYLQESADYHVDLVLGADPLVAAFGSKSHDIIFAPTNLGAKMYQAKPDYIMLGVVVWGNFYLVTENPDINTFTDLDGKEVIVFGQNQTSDIIMKYIIANNNIDTHINYVDNVNTATETYLLDTSKVVLVAEPQISRIMMLKPNSKTIDLQELYQEIQGSDTYPQSGIFVKSDLKETLKSKIIADFKDSILKVNQYPEASAELAIQLGFDLPKVVIINAIPRSNLKFTTAKESKEKLEDYFSLLLSYQPGLIGHQLPDQSFYGG